MTTLLITGVTGFLGGAALEKILHQETRLDLLLLVRADSPEAGLERVKENMRKFNISSTAPLSPHLAATRLSGRLTLRARCAWRNGWRR